MFNLIQSSAKLLRSQIISDLAYEATLLMKGIQLKSTINTMSFVLQQADSSALYIYQNLLRVKRQLADQYQWPIKKRNGVMELELEAENLEKDLARLSSKFRTDLKAGQISLKEIRSNLKSGEAAIEFVRFVDVQADSARSVWYGAIVLIPSAANAIFIPLFEENKLENILGEQHERKFDYVNRLYNLVDRGARAMDEYTQSLYDLIWSPLQSYFDNIHTIYCSPTGLLNRINLDAIPIDEETNCGDKFKLKILLSTGKIVGQTDTIELTKKSAVIYGGVQYEYDSTSIKSILEIMDISKKEMVENELIEYVRRSRNASKRGMGSWEYLRWTIKEVENIRNLFAQENYSVSTLTGIRATEESFKLLGSQTQSPYTIHLATHGFFFPEPESGNGYNDALLTFMNSTNPMFRSGLILFGANRVWSGEKKLEGLDDGVLSAFEISQMNLSNTYLVVLSACESGLGDNKGTEGVFGLQRAFKMAGVKYLIFSLWQVPDFQTQDLMTTFYQKWLTEKIEIREAFRLAQQDMRVKYQNPYFWAGFVMIE